MLDSITVFEPTCFVDVILPLALPGTFTYAVPSDLESAALPGVRVEVQFGRKKIYAGIIRGIVKERPKDMDVKFILSVLDDTPVVYEQQFVFWDWMANYYCCTIGEIMDAALPAGLKLQSESRIILNPAFDRDYTSLNDREFLVAEALDVQHELTLDDLSKLLQLKSVYPIVQSLIRKQVILIREELIERFKPKTETYIQIHDKFLAHDSFKQLLDELERAPKQQAAVLAYWQHTHPLRSASRSIQRRTFIEQYHIDASIIHALCKKGIFTTEERIVGRTDSLEESILSSFNLSAIQEAAMAQIEEQWKHKPIVLLQGVTGSGKTNIYIKLIENTLAEGKQVLYLLPEIALTTQITTRLKSYFGNTIGIYHSRFNQQERVEIWNNLYNNKHQLILGARSALFLPFRNLGLIIVDEEHDSSYKQQDSPRYHARDSAMAYARQLNATVLLGTATPSLETYHNVKEHRFGYVKLTERFGDSVLPEVCFVNLRDEKRNKQMKGYFSNTLLEEIKKTIADKKQVILFQNRRGYAPYISCEQCSYVPHCINCDVSLTYHKFNHQLKCHYCGYTKAPLSACPDCKSTHLSEHGFGTEKIEDDLSVYMPEARIARMDMDTVRTKNSHNKLIDDMQQGNIDVLIGTQMVTKGLDFDHVALVGILSADQLLQFPDFRSNERAFQLIQQVSGRAGRRSEKGKVIIQVQNINNPVIQFLKHHDTDGYYTWEMMQREKLSFPPFCRLAEITLSHKDHKTVKNAAATTTDLLRQTLGSRVSNAIEPPVNKVRNEYLMQLIIKTERNSSVQFHLRQAVEKLRKHLGHDKDLRSVRLRIDIDAY
ncbi:MAG: primosomal protein N' [Bacteroidota bacterium]